MARSRQHIHQEVADRLSDDEILLIRPDAAPVICRSPATLERWAQLGIGPKVTRLNGRVYYRLSDLKASIANESQAA